MHIPDGFINGATSAAAGVIAAGGVGVSLRRAGRFLQDKRIPLTGLVAAFVFVLQMLNFPVAAGTSGHLLGGALAVILVGPWLGITAVAVVVIVQAFLFADGGVSALGLNVLNMALLTGIVGWGVFRGLTRVLPRRWPSVIVATFAAGLASVVASATGFVIQYGIGGSGGIDIDTVFGAMVGVHFVIGIGEGLISATVIGAVAASRPDLVSGVAGLDIQGGRTSMSGRSITGFVVAAVAIGLVLVFAVAPLASSAPDGLERVAQDLGFADTATDSAVSDSPLADYEVGGEGGTGIAGGIGATVTLAVGIGGLTLWRRSQRRRYDRTRVAA
ncbi:MAG: energy-coupling factor ABC transporter permease [Acidimicrobiia bacterium]|nr:energy-coupling factor ABC transporter permease [Acidimicrobiia bacterium]